jgi:hypothetical protein
MVVKRSGIFSFIITIKVQLGFYASAASYKNPLYLISFSIGMVF